MKIKVTTKGNFMRMENFLEDIKNRNLMGTLKNLGQLGVDLLEKNTPKDTGLTASSWYYDVVKTKQGYDIQWKNRNTVEGYNVALLIQYGHGTVSGGYVSGIDYINPVMDQIFKTAKIDIGKEVFG